MTKIDPFPKPKFSKCLFIYFFVAVHDASGLVDNAAESESEDEWNYIKGEVANKENIPPQPEKEVCTN